MPNESLASIEGPLGRSEGPLGRSFWFLSVHLRALFLLVGTAVLVARCDCTARLQEW